MKHGYFQMRVVSVLLDTDNPWILVILMPMLSAIYKLVLTPNLFVQSWSSNLLRIHNDYITLKKV